MAWNGGELDYLVRLLESRGNKSVPRESIVSYLNVQRHSAYRDGEFDIAENIRLALKSWQAGEYGEAVRVMRDAWAEEQNL